MAARIAGPFFGSLLAWLLCMPAPGMAEPQVERTVALDGQVRALAVADGVLVAAGPTPDGRAWYGLFDPHTLTVRSIHRPSCHRCALLGAAAGGDGTVVLVGRRQDASTAPARGWVLRVDAASGAVRGETFVAGRGPVTLRAVDVADDAVLAGGEAEPAMGADAVGVAVLLRLPDLALQAEWPFEHAAPQTVQSVRILGPGDFLAGGWALDRTTALPAGWLARFGFKGEPFWRRTFPAADGPEVVALLPKDTRVRVVGHRVAFDRDGLHFAPVTVAVEPAEGRIGRRSTAEDSESRMVGAAVSDGEAVLAAVAVGRRGAERAGLLRLGKDGGETLSLAQVRGRATLPAALVRLADGALVVGGWLRGDHAPQGWLARVVASADRGARDGEVPLRLELACSAQGLRVMLKNRSGEPVRVRPLRRETVRLLPAAAAPRSGVIGAMPGRPPTPPEPRVEIPAGGRLVLELPLPAQEGPLRAVYSPDFAGYGLGRLLVSPPLDPERAGCRRGSDRGRG